MSGKLELEVLNGMVNQQRYFGILRYNFLPWARTSFQRIFLLAHDNATSHTAQHAHNFLAGDEVEVMQWPAWRPDLNPIEYIWDQMGLFIGFMLTPPTHPSSPPPTPTLTPTLTPHRTMYLIRGPLLKVMACYLLPSRTIFSSNGTKFTTTEILLKSSPAVVSMEGSKTSFSKLVNLYLVQLCPIHSIPDVLAFNFCILTQVWLCFYLKHHVIEFFQCSITVNRIPVKMEQHAMVPRTTTTVTVWLGTPGLTAKQVQFKNKRPILKMSYHASAFWTTDHLRQHLANMNVIRGK